MVTSFVFSKLINFLTHILPLNRNNIKEYY